MRASEPGADLERVVRRLALLLALTVALVLPSAALASGGNYTISGGTSAEQGQVHAALDASSFDWSLIPRQIQVQITKNADSYATPGVVVLNPSVLDAGRFSWATVQHEFGHQVDFLLLDDTKRAVLQQALGGQDWCYSVSGLQHSAYGCERFASMMSWAYWSSADSSLRPLSSADEAGAMAPAAFRLLLAGLLGTSTTTSEPLAAKAFAPKIAPARKARVAGAH